MPRQQTGGRLKAAAFMAVAALIAALVSFIVWRMVQAANAQLQAASRGPKRIEVVAAANDLYMGIPITLEDLATVQVLPGTVPEELVFTDVDELVGRTPRERILAGEIIRAERLADPSAGAGLNAVITPGKRAMTIEADTESSLGGLLRPGNYVDVIVTIRPDSDAVDGKWVSETILQAVRVLAVGGETRPEAKETRSRRRERSSRRKVPVTLELTLDEAEKLALADSRGDLHLVLRSDVDIILQETGGPLNTTALLGVPPEKAAEVARKARRRVRSQLAPERRDVVRAEVIQGSEREEVHFDRESGERVDEGRNRRGTRRTRR